MSGHLLAISIASLHLQVHESCSLDVSLPISLVIMQSVFQHTQKGRACNRPQ